jgi:di/tricarboxylate transporter
MVYEIIALIYVIGIFVTYFCFASKWEKQSKAEQIYFSIIWPLLIPLYLIHLLIHKG